MLENIFDLAGTIVTSDRFDDTNHATAEGFYFYHYDMRGSTTAIVGANGNLQKGYTYDVFGSLEEKGNVSFLNEVTFTGSVTDKSTGLQYMNARFYNPTTGRFISQDTYTGNPYDPWTQHLYTYCGNNPTNMVDPTGHFAIEATLGTIWGVALGEPTWIGEVVAAVATVGILLYDTIANGKDSVLEKPGKV